MDCGVKARHEAWWHRLNDGVSGHERSERCLELRSGGPAPAGCHLPVKQAPDDSPASQMPGKLSEFRRDDGPSNPVSIRIGLH